MAKRVYILLGLALSTVIKELSYALIFKGHFIEVQVSGGALYRTKIHCYFLDQSRVIRLHPTEKNYHIFYQLMAGLNPSERRQLGLQV